VFADDPEDDAKIPLPRPQTCSTATGVREGLKVMFLGTGDGFTTYHGFSNASTHL